MSGGGGGHKRRGHEEEHEEHENHERWLVSYADMMTLLMVLFIVMFAISQVDQKKFAALKTGLSAGFGAPVAILSGADQLLDVGGSVAPDSVNLAGQAGSTDAQSKNDSSQVNPEAVAKLARATSQAQVAKEVNNLKNAQKQLQAALNRSGQKGRATFRFDQRGLVVSIATDKVLFASGSARLEPGGAKILNTLAPTLKALPNELSVDGHTNSIPIHTAQFPSNWELSSDRATGVLRYLHSQDGIPNGRMSATGYADTHPLLPAGDPRARSANRRVEIVVVASVDNSAGRAVATLGNSRGTPNPIVPGGALVAAQSGSSGRSSSSSNAGTNRQAVIKGIQSGAEQLGR
jgi:chemotaxis protein MotB